MPTECNPDQFEFARVEGRAVVASFDENDRQALRETLRSMINRHKSFPQAAWSLKAEDLAPLEAIFAELEPKSAAARHRCALA